METEKERRARLENDVASYSGAFTRAVRAGRDIKAWYHAFAHA